MSSLEIILALFILSFWTLFPLAIYFSTKDLSENEKDLMRLGKNYRTNSLSNKFMRQH